MPGREPRCNSKMPDFLHAKKKFWFLKTVSDPGLEPAARPNSSRDILFDRAELLNEGDAIDFVERGNPRKDLFQRRFA